MCRSFPLPRSFAQPLGNVITCTRPTAVSRLIRRDLVRQVSFWIFEAEGAVQLAPQYRFPSASSWHRVGNHHHTLNLYRIRRIHVFTMDKLMNMGKDLLQQQLSGHGQEQGMRSSMKAKFTCTFGLFCLNPTLPSASRTFPASITVNDAGQNVLSLIETPTITHPQFYL